jgi:predicted enzyme related to lactoylglutathione lyase
MMSRRIAVYATMVVLPGHPSADPNQAGIERKTKRRGALPVSSFPYTKIMVNDAASLERFYVDVLGLGHVRRIDEGAGEHAFIEIFLSAGKQQGGAQLVLMQYLNRPAPTPGEALLAFMVDDLHATVAAVQGADGGVTVPAFDIDAHHLRMAYVTDPEGHTLELMQFLAR